MSTLKALRTKLFKHSDSQVLNRNVQETDKDCGKPRMNPAQKDPNESELYFKIQTYSKVESDNILKTYQDGTLKFDNSGLIQAHGRGKDNPIKHSFCTGNCLTDKGNQQNGVVDDYNVVFKRNAITSKINNAPRFIFSSNGMFMLRFNYSQDNTLINITLHLNPHTQHYFLNGFGQSQITDYYKHCANTDFRDPNCTCIQADLDNNRGNLCFANMFKGFKNTCGVLKYNKNKPSLNAKKDLCPTMLLSNSNRNICSDYILNTDTKKYPFQTALRNFKAIQKVNENVFQTCETNFIAEGDINNSGNIDVQCDLDKGAVLDPVKTDPKPDPPKPDTPKPNPTNNNPVNPTNNTTNDPANPPKKNSNVMMIVIVILILLALGGIGYYLFK